MAKIVSHMRNLGLTTLFLTLVSATEKLCSGTECSVECHTDRIVVSFDKQYLEDTVGSTDGPFSGSHSVTLLLRIKLIRQKDTVGSTDQRFIHMGSWHYHKPECRAHLNKSDGRIELIMNKKLSQCGTQADVKCGEKFVAKDGVECVQNENEARNRKLVYHNQVYFNALLEGHHKSELDETYGLINHTNYPIGNPRFPLKYKILDWKCEYDGHYDLEIEINQNENNDVPNNLIERLSDVTGEHNGEWPYFGLKPRIFSYSTPEFTVDDLMPKYAFKQSQFELEFNKIETEWVSIQTILDQDPNRGDLNVKTALQKCWISNQVSTNTNGQDFFDLLSYGCTSNEDYVVVYGTGAGNNTRFSWNAESPELSQFFNAQYPAYLHCTLRICLPEESVPCPEMCDHGTPDSNWFENMGYEPLTLNVMGGPYFLSSTNAVDLTRIREIDDQYAPPDIVQDDRFINMFGNDGEVHNRESQDIQLPIWVPIVISVLVGFAMGLALITVVAKKCARGQKGKYRVSFHEEQHRKSVASMAKTAARENDFNAVRRNMQNM